MKKYTRQTAFNKAYRGLKAQGFKQSKNTVSGFTVCTYRGQDDCRCAFGHLVSNDLYRPAWEGTIASHYISKLNGEIGDDNHPFVYGDVFFYDNLQSCHDQAGTPVHMEEKLRDFAAIYELKVPR